MLRRAGSGLLLAVVVFSLLGASSAMASTTTSLKTVHYGGDSFRNFDFDSQRASAGNVDWPVDLVFWGNASVDKVYAGIAWSLAGSNEYGRLNDGTGAIWVPSAGRKSGLCSGTHFRLYAPPVGYLSNRKLGHYVIATAHVDKNECFGSAQYGWNETAEATIASRAVTAWGAANVQANATLMPDGITSTFSLFGNAQSEQQGSHFFDNNGLPTLIHVP
ncbi:MAG: hypothetical protein ACHQEA_07190 [Gaiellales bacterium]